MNDGKWHHIAAVMPKDNCLLSEVQLFVDGNQVKAKLVGADRNIHINQAVRLGFGGLNYSTKSFDQLAVKPFVGELDEISIWTRPLPDTEVAALFRN